MAGAFSAYTNTWIANWLRSTAAPTAPTTLWMGLFTTMPTNTATSPTNGTEVSESGTGYTRVASGGFSAPALSGSAELISNNSAITFPTASSSWGTVVGWGAWDSMQQAGAPSAPSATGNTGSGSSFTASQTVKLQQTYVTFAGETLPSSTTTVTIGSSTNNVVVTLPSFPTGVVGMNVYASTSNGSTTLYKVTAGSSATSTSSAGTVTITGFAPNTNASPPGADTSGGNLLFYGAVNPTQAITTGQQPQMNAGVTALSID